MPRSYVEAGLPVTQVSCFSSMNFAISSLGVITFLDKLALAITQHRLISDGDSVLIAVSGGVDSMVLLRALTILAPKHGWKLTVAHFNHQLRGKSSDADQR